MIRDSTILSEIYETQSFETQLRYWAAKKGLVVTASSDEEFFSVRYDQRIANMRDPIVQECRGLIFDWHGNIVARPFTKFFNMHEPEAPCLQPAPVYATEKRDGSCVYAYKSQEDRSWKFATLGSPLAEGGLPEIQDEAEPET